MWHPARRPRHNLRPQRHLNGIQALEPRSMMAADIAEVADQALIVQHVQGVESISEAQQDVAALLAGATSGATSVDQLMAIGFDAQGGSEVIEILARAATSQAPKVLGTFYGLTVVEGESSVQIGSYLTAKLNAHSDANGTVTLTFSDIHFNLGQLIGNSQAKLLAKIKPLVDAAQQLTSPIKGLPGWTHDIGLDKITPVQLLRLAGRVNEANQIETFAKTIDALQVFAASLKGDGWVELANGELTVTFASGSSVPSSVTGKLIELDVLLKQVGIDPQSVKNVLSMPALENPQQLAKLLMGQSVDLIKYTLPELTIKALKEDLPLATFPTPIPAGCIQISLHADLSFSAKASVVFNSSGLESGDIAKGLSLQDAQLSATFNVGLSGTYWQAFVIGYRVTGKIGFLVEDFQSPVTVRSVERGMVSPFADKEAFTQFLQTLKNNLPGSQEPSSRQEFLISVGVGLSQKWKISPGTIATVLGKDLGVSLVNVAQALLRVNSDLSVVAGALFNVTTDPVPVAKALWSVTSDLGQVAKALYSNGVTALGPLTKALYGLTGNLGQVAGALYQVTKDVGEVAKGLWTVTNDLNQVAKAIYNNASKDLVPLAKALWNVKKDLYRVAEALNTRAGADLNVIDTAKALSSIDRDLIRLAKALRYGAGNGPYDVAKGLWSVDANLLKVAQALKQASFSGVEIAKAILSSKGLDRSVTEGARALYNRSGADLSVYDTVKALWSVTTNVYDVAKALDSSKGANLSIYNTAWALWQVTKDYFKVAKALYSSKGADLSGLNTAKALWFGGIGINTRELVSALYYGHGADLSRWETARAIWNCGAGLNSYQIAWALYKGTPMGYGEVAEVLYRSRGLNFSFNTTVSALYYGIGGITWDRAWRIVKAI